MSGVTSRTTPGPFLLLRSSLIYFLAVVAAGAMQAEAADKSIEVCVTKAIVLPAKMSGDPWDSGGKKRSPSDMLNLQTLASGGGLGAVQAAGLASEILQGGSGAPDIFVVVEVNKSRRIRTSRAFNSLNAQWGSSADPEGCHLKGGEKGPCNTCATLRAEEATQMIDIQVWDEDAFMDDPAGRMTSPKGVPVEALREGLWRLNGFDSVVELQFSIREVAATVPPRSRRAKPISPLRLPAGRR